MHSYYTVFDYTNMRIGFVEQYRAPEQTVPAKSVTKSVSATLLNLYEASMTSAQVTVTQELLNFLVLI